MTAKPARRISVVGTTGSGKTMTARHISRCLKIPHMNLDALHWRPDWTPEPRQVSRARVADAVGGATLGLWMADLGAAGMSVRRHTTGEDLQGGHLVRDCR